MAPGDVRRHRVTAITVAAAVIALTVTFGAINSVAYRGEPLAADAWWMTAVVGDLGSPWLLPSLFLHEIGSGLPAFVMTSAITGALLLWRRPWGAVFFATVALVSTGVVEVLKNSIGRPRPAEALIDVGFGSYPSGHSARAATIAVALGILLPRLWVWMLGAAYALAMMFSRTQLGAHWLTDTIAGALTGAAVVLVCYAVVAEKLEAEGARRHPPPWLRRT